MERKKKRIIKKRRRERDKGEVQEERGLEYKRGVGDEQ